MSTKRPSPVDLTSERINELSRSFWNSAILRSGLKLGVFSMLDKGPVSADEVAHRLEASPRFVYALLESCVALGLLDRKDGEYSNTDLASRSLVQGEQEYVGDLVLHITNHWASWGQLDQLIKKGQTLPPFESGYVDSATYWTDYMMGQHNRASSGQAYYLVHSLDLSGRRKLLDLGGGAASYSIALCSANPQLQAVVVDQKEPLEIAKALVEEHRLQDRIHLLEGDFNSLDLGKDNDVVLISGVVLIKSEGECRRIFRIAYDTLVPGGLVIVQDFMRIDRSPERQLLDTLMDMYVLIAFDSGAGDRDGDEVASWLQDLGFRKASKIPLPTHLALVTAEKPVTAPSLGLQPNRAENFLPTDP